MSGSGADSDIVGRMKDFFERQIEWFEQIQGDLERLDEAEGLDDSDRLAAEDSERAGKSRALEEEFRVLKKEWDVTAPEDGTEAEVVRSLARKAEELGLALQESFGDASRELLSRSVKVREEIEKMQQAKNTVSKYRAPDANDANYMDRNA